MKNYINHSGGCEGADMCWENEGLKYEVGSVSYSFHNHVQYSYNQKILNTDELNEGWGNVLIAEKTLQRNLSIIQFNHYVKNLISRNWFQVKNADAIFAVSTFLNDEHKIVNGGTGWAVQMGIDNKKPIYFYDQEKCEWYWYDYNIQKFVELNGIPKLSKNFAGIGSAKLNENGINAIKEIYEANRKWKII
jgi:hypothetical protein